MQKLEKESIRQFDLWAKFHQLFSLPFYFLNRKIAKIVNPAKNTSVLDIGCGWGILFKELLRMNRGLKLYGLDISPKMVSVARNKFTEKDNVVIVEGSAQRLPFEDNFFDYVTCILSFHHHPDSLQSLKEMFRVLKPGGKVFLLDPYKNGFFAGFMVTVNNIVFQERDIHVYKKEDIASIFKQAGFTNIEQKQRNLYHLFTIAEKSVSS